MSLNRASKFLSLILRHDPGQIGITLDPQGWAVVDDLIKGMNDAGSGIGLKDLKVIVETDAKNRYSFSADGLKIRANQGHSVPVDLGLVELQPPDVLYHGTATRFWDSISTEGIKKMSRQYVHLSSDIATATSVGSRHGKLLVLTIDAKSMYTDGVKFYQSENGVWLTDDIPLKYVTKDQ